MESLLSFVIVLDSMQIKKGTDMKTYVNARNCLETTSRAFDIINNKNVNIEFIKECFNLETSVIKQLSAYNKELKNKDNRLCLDEFKTLMKALVDKKVRSVK